MATRWYPGLRQRVVWRLRARAGIEPNDLRRLTLSGIEGTGVAQAI